MKVHLYIIFTGFLVIGCGSEDKDERLRQEVLEADKKFSTMASEKGIAEAFIYYADERVIKPQPGQQPVVGKFALMEWYKNNPPGDVKLTWQPLRGEASGSLGYTFGGYELHSKNEAGRDTVFYGNYVSVWKRKKDGSWRYIIDTGNSTPGPVTLKPR